jgi:hypothetical protein
MRTRDEIEAALNAAGWNLIAGPMLIVDPGYIGWRATIQCGNASKQATGHTALGVLKDLLRAAQEHARKQP